MCVAQYEMKLQDSKVVSAPSGEPHSVTREQAQNLCETSFESGRLPTNVEWTIIANIIKTNPLNWTGGSVEVGSLVTGLTRRWGNPVSAEDTDDSYTQTGASALSHAEQRRTFYIDAENVLWDFGGNAWEWVSDEIHGNTFSPSFADTWAHNPRDTYWFTPNSPQLELFFLGERPGNTNYLGYIFGGQGGYVLRGAGTYMNSQETGIFTADLGSGAVGLAAPKSYGLPTSARNVGFRCVVELK